MKETYVVDASVVLKWLNQEHELAVENALILLLEARNGSCHLISSDFLPHEIFNALIRGKRIAGKQLVKAINNFFSFPIELAPTTKQLVTRAAYLASRYGMTFYDAVYVALADMRKVPLITENIRHQGKFKKIPVLDIALWPDDSYPTRMYTDDEIKQFLKDDKL